MRQRTNPAGVESPRGGVHAWKPELLWDGGLVHHFRDALQTADIRRSWDAHPTHACRIDVATQEARKVDEVGRLLNDGTPGLACVPPERVVNGGICHRGPQQHTHTTINTQHRQARQQQASTYTRSCNAPRRP